MPLTRSSRAGTPGTPASTPSLSPACSFVASDRVFVADWNNFFLPYVVLADSTQYPIQVGLSHLLSSTPSFNPATGGGGQSVLIFRPELALATLIAVVPVAIVVLLSQRAIVRGLFGGGIKE